MNAKEHESSQPEQSEETESVPEPELPVLEPGDRLMIATRPDYRTDTPEIQKRNVLDKLTDRGKDIISSILFDEERNEHKFDESERKKAEKYARSNDSVLLTDALGGRGARGAHLPPLAPAPLAQVVEGRVITESTKDALEGVEGNSKLWIGKDYTNFIVKDFNNLDLPFVGEFFHILNCRR